MTIGELKDTLKGWPDDYEIILGCPELKFYRLKQRGDKLIQLEFSRSIYKDNETGRWHVDE